MSRLDELIVEFCPEGVEVKPLFKVGSFYGGLSGKSIDDFSNGNAKYITYMNVFSNPVINVEISDQVRIFEGERQNTLEYGDVIFTGSSETPNECGMSSVVTQKIEEKIFLNSFCFGLRFFDRNLFIPDFSKYLFRSEGIRKQIVQTANGVTRFNVSKKKMCEVQIPIPPLRVQQEIVHILDNFTTLEAELEAELEARKKQFEYYRNSLLTFGDDVPRKKIGDVLKNGNASNSISKNNYKLYGDFPIIDQSKSFFAGYTDDETAIPPILPCIIFGDHTRIVKYSEQNFAQGDSGTKVFIPIDSSLNTKYIYYAFCNLDIKSRGYNRHWSIVKDMLIPIPSLEIQKEFVRILDYFNSIVNDISIGLPAEIVARHKQYEYYCNKLLTFKVVKA